MNIVEILQASLVPMVIVSAAALLSLSLQQRYGRVIDRIRIFHEKLMKEREWKHVIEGQMRILIKRGKLLRNSMFFLMTCILSATFSIFLLSTVMVYGLEETSIEKMVLWLHLFSIFFLSISMIFAMVEMFISYKAILEENEKIGKIQD